MTTHFAKYERFVEKRARDVLEAVGDNAVDRTRQGITRVDTGAMRDSVGRTKVVRILEGWAVMVYIGAWYGRFQELGTRAGKGKAKTARTAARRKAAFGVGGSGVKPMRALKRALFPVRAEAQARLKLRLRGFALGRSI